MPCHAVLFSSYTACACCAYSVAKQRLVNLEAESIEAASEKKALDAHVAAGAAGATWASHVHAGDSSQGHSSSSSEVAATCSEGV
jgi:hypothetical protein